MVNSFNDFKEKVRDSTDLVAIVSEYVDLKKVGKNYQGLCPFHQEKTPSFTINPDQQFYHCFGCGVGGDVFNFLMEIENITFKESLKVLAKRAGMDLPQQTRYQKQKSKKRDKLFEINNLVARFYNYLLLNSDIGKGARQYLEKRGFKKSDIEKFKLGYAPERWKALLSFLRDKGYKKEELVKAGLVQKKNNNYYDRFRGRIIFPIFNVREEVLAFGARLLDNTNSSMPKYLNSPGTLIYNKGDNLYGLNWARKKIRQSKDVIIMEGYTDVLTAHKFDIDNAVASLGTALTSSQARILKRYAETVYIAYDADTAGAKATLRGLDIVKEVGLKVKVINLPLDEDPDDYIREHGFEKFKKLQKESLNLMDFKINQILKNNSDTDSESKISLSRKLIDLIANLDDAIEKDIYIQKIAEKLEIDSNLIRQEVKKYSKNEIKQEKNNQNINKTNSNSSINKVQRNLLKAFIEYNDYRKEIYTKLNPDYFTGVYKKAANWLWCNNKKEISSIINEIKDEDIRKMLMEITVEEEINITLSLIKSWINNLKENICFKYKINIYKKIQNKSEIKLSQLNKLLISFKKIDSNLRKEGL